MTVNELVESVSKLSPSDLQDFAQWFEEFISDEWDCRIEREIQAGKLESMGLTADDDFESGRCTAL